MDVISHIPVLCEDHNVPYVYVSSRAELGAAGSTKRPTSVVMVTPQQQGGKKKEVEGEEKEDWSELYADLAKVRFCSLSGVLLLLGEGVMLICFLVIDHRQGWQGRSYLDLLCLGRLVNLDGRAS